MVAVMTPAGVLPAWMMSLAGIADVTTVREGILAVLSVVLYVLVAPRGRRRLSWFSITLIGLVVVPLSLAIVFPEGIRPADADGSKSPLGHTNHILRFLLVASVLQSLLLLLAVAAWERIAKPLPKIFLDILRCIMLAVALLIVLWDAGINAGELVTGSALVTAVLGFALRDTLGNVFAGLAIHAEHPFEVGDWIQYDANQAHIGRVVEINWRATKVLTLDEAYVIVPNGQLAQASIRNFTKPEPWSRRSLFVVTPYEVSPQKVQRIILDAIRGSFGVLEHPAPSVVTNAFTERGVEHWVRLFTTDFDKRDRVDGMARDRIWFALARNGIEIPTATQAIRLTHMSPSLPPEPAESALARRVESLERVGILEVLGGDQVRRLAAETQELRFAAGEAVVRQNEPGTSMFIVLDGNFDVSVIEEGVGPVLLARMGPGDYFGEMSLMTGAARTATVTATTEARVLEVGKESFRRVLESEPSLLARLGSALRKRLEERASAIARGGRSPEPTPPDLFQRIREYFAM